jgi:hypothetical protein
MAVLSPRPPTGRRYEVVSSDMAIGNSSTRATTHEAAQQIVDLARKVGKLFVVVDNSALVYAVPAGSKRALVLEDGYPVGVVGVFNAAAAVSDLVEAIHLTANQLAGRPTWVRRRVGRPPGRPPR